MAELLVNKMFFCTIFLSVMVGVLSIVFTLSFFVALAIAAYLIVDAIKTKLKGVADKAAQKKRLDDDIKRRKAVSINRQQESSKVTIAAPY